MDTKDIIIFAAVFAFIGFRLYQKYGKKNPVKPGGTGEPGHSDMSSSSKDDDYEPYSKK